MTPKNQASLAEITFIVLDLETTGASPANGCGITEIGAIAVRGGELLEEFSTFVNPQVALPEYIINLTGIAQSLSHNWPKYEVIDTVKLARRVIDRSEIQNYKLGTLSQFFDTKALPNHRALDDVKTTVEVLHRLIERLAGFEVFSISQLKKFMR